MTGSATRDLYTYKDISNMETLKVFALYMIVDANDPENVTFGPPEFGDAIANDTNPSPSQIMALAKVIDIGDNS